MSDGLPVSLARAVDADSPREERAQKAAAMIRDARGYRWVGIYDVGDEEIALIGHSGAEPPQYERFSIDQGLSGEAVRTRCTVVDGPRSETIVPILGAEAGIVIGTLDVESNRLDAFDAQGVAFLEECAAALRPLYD